MIDLLEDAVLISNKENLSSFNLKIFSTSKKFTLNFLQTEMEKILFFTSWIRLLRYPEKVTAKIYLKTKNYIKLLQEASMYNFNFDINIIYADVAVIILKNCKHGYPSQNTFNIKIDKILFNYENNKIITLFEKEKWEKPFIKKLTSPEEISIAEKIILSEASKDTGS